MDLMPKSAVFQPKTFDEKVKTFAKIPFTFEILSFWHYRIPPEVFCQAVSG
jgi:hypothetical protein